MFCSYSESSGSHQSIEKVCLCNQDPITIVVSAILIYVFSYISFSACVLSFCDTLSSAFVIQITMDKNAQEDEKKHNFLREHSDKVIFISFSIIAMATELDSPQV